MKILREDRHETLAEVSGAVEIEAELLEKIERGEERPSEDVLMLLINHFALPEREAVQLWESAGYTQDDADDKPRPSADAQVKNMVVLLAVDARVLYGDGLSVDVGKHGMILNFTQTAAQGQPLPVARVGMSYEQAEAALQVLQQALLRRRYAPKRGLLPPGDAEKQ